MPSSEFLALMDRKLDAPAAFLVEILDASDVATDVTRYYRSGGGISQSRNRYPDQIEVGSFDIVFANTDDTFSEYKAASLFFGQDYHQKWRVRISQGYRLAAGSIEYLAQSTAIIDELVAGDSDSIVTIRCRDKIAKLIDARLRNAATQPNGVPDPGNFSNGTISPIATLPFKAVTEDWTVVCTTPGPDGTAQFSVTGTASGSVGPATGGFEFSTLLGAGGIKFTLTQGSGDWVAGDTFTFSTRKAPEWTLKNPVKIIWAILTGYNWDTDVAYSFADALLDYDHTQSDSNVDLDYNTFAQAVSDVDALSTLVTGYIPYNAGASEQIAGLLLLILGSLYTGNDGRMRMSTYSPTFNPDAYRNFADTKKIISLGYSRATTQAINQITVNFKNADVWAFSDGAEDLAGNLVLDNADSESALGQTFSQPFTVPWFSPNGTHVQDFSQRLLDKYGTPPLNLQFETVGDALATNIGDHVSVTDAKYGLDAVQGEVDAIDKNFDANPRSTRLTVRREGSDVNTRYGFLGSSEDEGDGISPQAANFDDATDSDKLFIYLGADPLFEIADLSYGTRRDDTSQTDPVLWTGLSGMSAGWKVTLDADLGTLDNYAVMGGRVANVRIILNSLKYTVDFYHDRLFEEEGGVVFAHDCDGNHLWEILDHGDGTLDVYKDSVLLTNLGGGVSNSDDGIVWWNPSNLAGGTTYADRKLEGAQVGAVVPFDPPYPDYHLF